MVLETYNTGVCVANIINVMGNINRFSPKSLIL